VGGKSKPFPLKKALERDREYQVGASAHGRFFCRADDNGRSKESGAYTTEPGEKAFREDGVKAACGQIAYSIYIEKLDGDRKKKGGRNTYFVGLRGEKAQNMGTIRMIPSQGKWGGRFAGGRRLPYQKPFFGTNFTQITGLPGTQQNSSLA